jgi:fumarate hydratase subunit alpha
MPKGFGSENNNALKMALPAEGIEGVKDFVVETALKAGGKPCPPIVVGVGIGGSSDMALKLGKKALLGKVGERNPDPTIAEMELECLERINKDGKGPMGLGGNTTALDVKILKMDTHTAGLPVGVVIQCWADRHATARLEDN